MNPFTALKNPSPFHFTSLHFISFFLLIPSTLHFTLICYSYLQLTSLHFPSLFTFYRFHFPSLVFPFLALFLKICVLPWEVPITPSGSLFQSVTRQGRKFVCTGFWLENVKERDRLKDLGLEGKAI
jgi:hypothetical protein